jgi:hypothetical protein
MGPLQKSGKSGIKSVLMKGIKMSKGLFTSLEEIKFQYSYIQGNVEKAYDPNTRKTPLSTKHLCSKKKNNKIPKIFMGRTR